MAILHNIVFVMIYCVIAFVVAEGLIGCWRYVKARHFAVRSNDARQVEPEAETGAELDEPARTVPKHPVSRLKATTPVPRRRPRSRLFRRQP